MMEIKLKDYDKKLHSVFDRRGKHKGVWHKPTSECYTLTEVQEAVKECAKMRYELTGRLPNLVFIANKPTYYPWRVFKFKRLQHSGEYSFQRLIYGYEFHGDAYVMVRNGKDLYEKTFGDVLESLERDLNSVLLVEYLRQVKLPVRSIYNLRGGYYIGGSTIVVDNFQILLFSEGMKIVCEKEFVEYLNKVNANRSKEEIFNELYL